MSKIDQIIENIKKKNFNDALKICEKIENTSNKEIILNFKGIINFNQGLLIQAENNFIESCNIKNDFIDPMKNLYALYMGSKKYNKAIFYINKIYNLDKKKPDIILNLAYAYELNNEFNNAIKYYNEYLGINGNDKKILNQIGCIYQNRNEPEKALNYFLKGYNLDKTDKLLVNNIFLSYIKKRDYKNSEIFYKISKEIDKDYIEFKFNFAEFCILNNKIDDAIITLKKNLQNLKFLVKLINLYFKIGERVKGFTLLKTKIHEIEKNSFFHNFLALRYLYEGEFEIGWKYYSSFDPSIPNFYKKLNELKELNNINLKNKHILVYNDQGIGDAIQFSKYISELLKIVKKVSFSVQDNIFNLFNNNIQNLTIEKRGLKNIQNIDYKIALSSLVKHFYSKKLDSNFNILKIVDKNNINQSIIRSNNKFNVGLVWSGSSLSRSIPLKSLEKILNIDCNFYCLQNKISKEDLDIFKTRNIIDLSKFKLDELTGVIQNLDLVITIDTSLLHLSSALNVETWGILNLDPDWRWGSIYNYNPYSSLKIFRQQIYNEWDDVIEKIYFKLKDKISLY